MATYHRRRLLAVRQALDEARFGAERTLNLRPSLPTAAEAVTRTESWLRQQQVGGATEVLIITGRGNQSPDGISPVRTEVESLLRRLRRRGVVARFEEHTPGSFTVGLASLRELWEAPRRKRTRQPSAPADPPGLAALQAETRRLLRDLAMRSLDSLGVRADEQLIATEMLTLFSALAAGFGRGGSASSAGSGSGEEPLRDAIRRAIDEYDDQ